MRFSFKNIAERACPMPPSTSFTPRRLTSSASQTLKQVFKGFKKNAHKCRGPSGRPPVVAVPPEKRPCPQAGPFRVRAGRFVSIVGCATSRKVRLRRGDPGLFTLTNQSALVANIRPGN
jgi:hypothetical protein